MFNGFFNFDAKFWKTLVPLLMKPGSVTKNYVQGKRNRYTNPFRFYLATSIIFFLIIGLNNSLEKFNELTDGTSEDALIEVNLNDEKTTPKNVDIDSLKNAINEDLKDSWIPLDTIKRREIVETIAESVNDSTEVSLNKNSINLEGLKINKYIKFQRKYPAITTDHALDSLGAEKTFMNRFLYSRAKMINNITGKADSQSLFINTILSYSSVSLFVLLPLFTLFLKLIYIRRKYMYVDHLIFVFHVQTVFFLLFTIFFYT